MRDLELARGLLRKLWQSYDTGGQSHGRSRDAALLEAAMDLMGPATGAACRWGDRDETGMLKFAQDRARDIRRFDCEQPENQVQ